jgi:hypothetical protein
MICRHIWVKRQLLDTEHREKQVIYYNILCSVTVYLQNII